MNASKPPASGLVLGVPVDDFHEFVDKAVTNGTKPGMASSDAVPQPVLSVEVSDFAEFSGKAVTSPAELRALARHKSDTSNPQRQRDG